MEKPRTVAVIQAKMASRQLYGKPIMMIKDEPNLKRVINRVKKAKRIDDIVVATTVTREDDAIEAIADEAGVSCYRGSNEDVLHRVIEAGEMMEAQVILRVMGNHSLIDFDLIDMGLETFFNNNCQIVTNVMKPSFPWGMDVEIFKFDILKQLDKKTELPPIYREELSSYFYQNPDKYKIINFFAPNFLRYSGYRFVLDNYNDITFIEEIYNCLYKDYKDNFGIIEIISLLKKYPELININNEGC